MRNALRMLSAAVLGLFPTLAFAQLGGGRPWCNYVPCGISGGAQGASAYLIGIGLELVTAFAGLVALYVFITALTMVTESAGEGNATGKKSLLSIGIGCIVVAMAASIVSGFGLGGGTTDAVVFQLENVVVAIRNILYVAVMANIVLQGFRMINSQGDEGQFDKAKQRLKAGFIGVAIVLLAQVIVGTVATGSSTSEIGIEIIGIANYLITLFGALAALAILIGGILLVVSVDESLKDKAKAAVKVAIITLIIVLFSAVIIRFFYSATPA